MGRIFSRKRKDGAVTYYGDFIDRRGQRRQVSLRTGDRAVARARLRDLELSTTDTGPHQTEALADALDYFTGVSCATKAEGTRHCYEQKARHLARLLGDVALDALSREHVERYIATRIREGANSHSVHKELVALRGALKAAKGRTFHGSLEVV